MSKLSHNYVYKSPIGLIGIRTNGVCLLELKFLDKNLALKAPNDNLSEKIFNQLDSYFKKEIRKFDLPIDVSGTNYQMKVWRKILKVSYGKTITYTDLARTINSHPRPVGNACRVNKLHLIIPCHRIVGKTNLGGYNGIKEIIPGDTSRKEFLINHEVV